MSQWISKSDGEVLYEQQIIVAREFGLKVLPVWDDLSDYERQRLEEMADEVNEKQHEGYTNVA